MLTEDAIEFPGRDTDSKMLIVFALEVVAEPVKTIASAIPTVLAEVEIDTPDREIASAIDTVFA